MQILRTVLIAAVAAVHTSAPPARVTRTESVPVRAVIDGDTIDVATYGRVRLLGIDAPEIGRGFDTSAPFGREARDRLMSLVLHRWVRLEQEGAALDAYNRRLAYVVRDDGLNANVVLVREGLARVTAREPLSRLGELQRAEAEAQAYRRGMWGSAPSIPPRGYTSGADATRRPKPRTSTPPTRPQTRTKTTKAKKTP